MTSAVAAAHDEPTERWEGCTAPELASAWGVPAVHLYASVGSTNDVARRLGDAGAASGTIVLAEAQRTGRGRAGRSWSSPSGLGLWLSVLHRPLEAAETAPLPLRVALAVADALDRHFDADRRVSVKWPNDLLVRGRKLGGILCEGSWEAGELRHVVVGIGINLLQAEDDFPETLRESATSLRRETGQGVGRFEVAGDVVRNLASMLEGRTHAGPLPRTLDGRDALAGREVEVLEPETGRTLARGTADGVGPDGVLLLRRAGGGEVAVHSGTVRLAGFEP